jgi:hypothetical protein
MQVSGTSGFTFPDNTTQATAASGFGFKNRILNGAMMIDQRNAGASVTASVGNAITYTLDRWAYYATQTSKFTVQQNAGSVTPPTGFKNYLGVTSSAATTVGVGDIFLIRQGIEGLNISDLGWGAAGAASVTLSFWVRSSLTGTFSGSLTNNAADRGYAFTYTISAANTWEQKTVTIAGDTSGTWLTTNGAGIYVGFSLGTGANFSGTANTWVGTGFINGNSSAVNVVATNGATFYITGVQLEKGSTATSFDYRPYGTELTLCKRYLPIYNSSTANNDPVGTHSLFSSTNGVAQFTFDVEPRVPPSGLSVTGTFRATIPGNNTWTVTPTLSGSSLRIATLNLAGTGMGTGFGTLLSASLPAQLQFTGCEL